jgi:hypothetical protein
MKRVILRGIEGSSFGCTLGGEKGRLGDQEGFVGSLHETTALEKSARDWLFFYVSVSP